MRDLLAAIIGNPEKVGELQPEAIPALMAQLAAIQTALAAQLLSVPSGTSGSPSSIESDVLLTAEQAAAVLNVTPNWLYRHAKQLPFTRRLSRKVLRFSQIGLIKWQAVKKS